jgi:hypothetical protein
MPQQSGPSPSRARRPGPRPAPRQSTNAPTRNGRGTGVRARLKRDPFLFLLCLGGLAFMTWAFALTWWVTGGVVMLALALVCIAPALFLFYLRDA